MPNPIQVMTENQRSFTDSFVTNEPGLIELTVICNSDTVAESNFFTICVDITENRITKH